MLPPLGDPWEPPAGGRPVQFTVTEMTGTFFGPGLRTEIRRSDVVARRCFAGNVALRISTGKLPFGSSASWRGPLPQPVATIADRQSGARARAAIRGCAPILPKAAGRYHGEPAFRRTGKPRATVPCWHP